MPIIRRSSTPIREYLQAHVERHGHVRTAVAFGVSHHTLWRFLERSRPGRADPPHVRLTLSLPQIQAQQPPLANGVSR